MKYRSDIAQGTSAPTKTEAVQKGELVAQVVESGITQYGNDDEKADLANFQRNPDRYAEMLQRVLIELKSRESAFAQQLQHVATQTNIAQTGGIHGTSTVYGDNLGQSIGVVSGGSVTQTNTRTGGPRNLP